MSGKLIEELRDAIDSYPADSAKLFSNAAEALESQARDIERLNREAKNDAIAYWAVIERQGELRLALAALKAQPRGVVPIAEISALLYNWDDLKSGDSMNVDAVRNWLASLNSSPVSSTKCQTCDDSGVVSTTDKDHNGDHIEQRCPVCAGGVDERAAFEAAWPSISAELPSHQHLLYGAVDVEIAERNAAQEGWKARAALTASAQDGVMFGFDDKSVMVSQEVYQIFMDRERDYREAKAPNHSEQVPHDLAMVMHQRDHYANRVFVLEVGIGKIASDFIPSSDDEAPIALGEMRDALESLLAAAPSAAHAPGERVAVPRDVLADLVSLDREKRISAERHLYALLAQQGKAVDDE